MPYIIIRCKFTDRVGSRECLCGVDFELAHLAGKVCLHLERKTVYIPLHVAHIMGIVGDKGDAILNLDIFEVPFFDVFCLEQDGVMLRRQAEVK